VGETKAVNVDLVETFNWLLGLKVKHMNAFWDKEAGRQGAGEKAETPMFRIVEGVNPKGEKVLVIWRKVRNLVEKAPKKIEKQREKANEGLGLLQKAAVQHDGHGVRHRLRERRQ